MQLPRDKNCIELPRQIACVNGPLQGGIDPKMKKLATHCGPGLFFGNLSY